MSTAAVQAHFAAVLACVALPWQSNMHVCHMVLHKVFDMVLLTQVVAKADPRLLYSAADTTTIGEWTAFARLLYSFLKVCSGYSSISLQMV